MPHNLAYEGAQYKIVWAIRANGRMLGKEFYDALPALDELGKPVRDKAKIMSLFTRLGDRGQIESQEHFRNLRGKLWEFKNGSVRMPCFYSKGRTI